MPFNIGPGELIIVLIIALIVVGPGKLPDVGASLGKSIREFRKAASDVTDSTKLEAAAPAAAAATPAAPASVAPAPAAPAPNVISAEAVPNTISTTAPAAVSEPAPQAPSPEAVASDEQPTPTA
jgi:TatA/E family protein of Tat protein translocase